MVGKVFLIFCLLVAKSLFTKAISTSGTFFKELQEGNAGDEKCNSEAGSKLELLDEGIFACERANDCKWAGKINAGEKEVSSLDAIGIQSGFCSIFTKMQATEAPDVPKFKDCQEAYRNGITQDGIIDLAWNNGSLYKAYCNMSIDGGGWTVFQRRVDPSVSFVRNWAQYVNGFGSLKGNFWLGLEALYQLTNYKTAELRIDLKDYNGEWGYVKYNDFKISGSGDNYRLQVAAYQQGNIGDSMAYSVGVPFSAVDNDNDESANNCADKYQGAWWMKSCFRANLNSIHYNADPPPNDRLKKMSWYTWKSEMGTITYSELKLRII